VFRAVHFADACVSDPWVLVAVTIISTYGSDVVATYDALNVA
jgi:hypothetical protein